MKLTPTRQHALWLTVIIVFLITYNPMILLVHYLVSLGWDFWSITLPALLVLAEVVTWTQTRRGVVYWVGVGLVATSPVAGLGFWLRLADELRQEIVERAKEGAKESLGTIRIQAGRREEDAA